MNLSPIVLVTALTLALPFSHLPSAPAVAQDRNCVSAQQAQTLVESGELLGVPEALIRAGKGGARPIGQASLCDQNSIPHWVVNVMNAYGESERIVLNAQAN